jgi:hypothetical protein
MDNDNNRSITEMRKRKFASQSPSGDFTLDCRVF